MCRCKACCRILSAYNKDDYCTVCKNISEWTGDGEHEYQHSLITEALVDIDICNNNGETGKGFYLDHYQYSTHNFDENN